MKYIYWNNKEKFHSNIIFECEANSILEADKILKEKTGIDVVKTPWIGCEIKPLTIHSQ